MLPQRAAAHRLCLQVSFSAEASDSFLAGKLQLLGAWVPLCWHAQAAWGSGSCDRGVRSWGVMGRHDMWGMTP